MDLDIIKYLDERNETLKNDIKEIIVLNTTAISGRLDAKMDEKLKPVLDSVRKTEEHNEKQNGWVASHNRRLDALDGDNGSVPTLQAAEIMNKQNRKFNRFFKKNWVKAVILVVVLLYGLHSLFEAFSLKQIIDFIAKVL